MIFIAFYIAAQINISEVHIHLTIITHKLYPIVIVHLVSYIIYSGCCHVYFCCVKALTCMLWLKLTLFVMLQPPNINVNTPNIKVQGSLLFVTYTIIQGIISSEM